MISSMDEKVKYTSVLEIKKKFPFQYLPSLRFITLDVKHLFRRKYLKAFNHPDYAYERWLGEYYQSEIESKRFPPIYISWIGKELGYGIFASENLPKNYWLGEYTGIVCKRSIFFKHNYYCMAYLREHTMFPKFCIDGQEMGNFTRLINHSYEPNCKLQTIYGKDLPHMGFITLKEIKKGEQITFNYGKQYWKECKKEPLPI